MSKKVDLILLQANMAQEHAQKLLSGFDTQGVAENITVIFCAWSENETNPESGLLHVYLKLDKPRHMTKMDIRNVEKRWSERCQKSDATASRMHKVFEIAGSASGQTPEFHYVVQTTPETGWFKEISNWYDEEHMPGLAGVPGCIHAVRMHNLDDGPQSFACYDLVDEDVMGSPEWLKVRATEWSSRCRPHFTNTRRNMFKVI